VPLDPGSQEFADARRVFEEHAASLVGLRLAAVRYVDLGSEPSETGHDRFPEFDLLDLGVELIGDDGRVTYVTWGSEFEHFNIALVDSGSPRSDDEVVVTWDVSDGTRWARLVGRTVTDVQIQWYEDEETTTEMPMWTVRSLLAPGLIAVANEPASTDPAAPTPRRPLGLRLGLRLLAVVSWFLHKIGRSESRQVAFPLSLALTFGDQRVWLAALVDDEPEPWRGADSITVVFDEDVAKRFGLTD
jgi:hypothetical protein